MIEKQDIIPGVVLEYQGIRNLKVVAVLEDKVVILDPELGELSVLMAIVEKHYSIQK